MGRLDGGQARAASPGRIDAVTDRHILFATGAPGSGWSGLLHAMRFAFGVNDSDLAPHRVYFGLAESDSRPCHTGSYFGPGMEFGDAFTNLDRLHREDITGEIDRAFPAGGGTLIVKGHIFAYHLTFLRETFPDASFVLVHRPDHACLEWWLRIGGFQIPYPDYRWYEDIERMRLCIEKENRSIIAFARDASARLRPYHSLSQLLEDMGMLLSADRIAELAGTAKIGGWGAGRDVGELRADLERATLGMQIAFVPPTKGPRDS